MRTILRSTAAALATVASLAMPGTAHANGAGHYGGNASINCFGCGVSVGTASIAFTGVYNGWTTVSGPATADYTVNEPAGAACLVTGTASGTVSGTLNLSFNWTRVGAVAVVTTSGDINGASVAVFVVTSPLGNPCGGPVNAAVQGAVAGL